jgi:cysteinyl-tRNA synthetase
MSPPRFVHKKISAAQFNAELARQNLSLPAFTRIWCQNLTTTTRWGNGQQDIPTWVPIALTLMSLDHGMGTARMAAADMIEEDRLRPELGKYPYKLRRANPGLTDDELILVNDRRKALERNDHETADQIWDELYSNGVVLQDSFDESGRPTTKFRKHFFAVPKQFDQDEVA